MFSKMDVPSSTRDETKWNKTKSESSLKGKNKAVIVRFKKMMQKQKDNFYGNLVLN